jgi:hypothetical protein
MKNLVICGVGVYATIGLLACAVWAIFQQSALYSLAIAFVILLVGSLTAFLVSWLYGNLVSGSVLLDCGPHPTRMLFWVNAVLFLLGGAGGSLGMIAKPFGTFGIAGGMLAIAFSAYWVIMACGRLQICENGIWQYWALLKWDKLRSFEWEGDTLLLQTTARFPFLGRGALPVPPEQHAAFDELLATHR